jgi:pyruvate,water dikinase
MSDYIFTFSDIKGTDIPLVGGKGANLGEMTRAGLPVPPGFCVSADAYRLFTARAGSTITQILAATRMDDPESIETHTAKLRDFLIAQPMPVDIAEQVLAAYAKLAHRIKGREGGALPVAVRSSATAEDLPDASFAGQQDTYLNIRGDEQLLIHVKRCWASLWTARATTYRHKQGYDHSQVALAVVVQAMIESEVAGILFTANPVNSNRDEMVLNASWGLGEAVVSGLVTPDTWVATKSGEIVEREIAAKELAIEYEPGGGTREIEVAKERSLVPCLDDKQIGELVTVGARVEQHYARPMDIEWAYAHGSFYMLQARPITTLAAPNQADGKLDVPQPAPVQAAMAGEYNRTMFVEIFPDPLSPAFLSAIAPLFQSMLEFTFETMGFDPPKTIPAIGVFYNQPYFYREYIQAALAPLSPQVQQALVTQIVNPFGKHERKLPTEASPAFVGMVTRLLRFMTSFPKQLPSLLASYRAEIQRFNALPIESLPDSEIVSRVQTLVFTHASKLLNYDFLMIALIGITYQMLGTLLEKYYGDDSEQVRAKLISGVTGNITMQTNIKLWQLAQEAKSSPTVRSILLAHAQDKDDSAIREELAQDGDGRIFLAELDAFLEQYGHREVRMDILYPTWGEDPAPVLQFVRGYFDASEQASPLNQQARLVREREQLAREVDAHVRSDLSGRLAVAPLFHWVLKNTQLHTRERDTMHFELTRLFPPFRRALLVLASRWQERGILEEKDDIFFLTLDEMQELAAGVKSGLADTSLEETIAKRRAEFDYNTRHAPPPILRDGVAINLSRARAESAQNELRGIAGSPGTVSGVVRVVRGPQEFDKLQRGEILVAPLTNPVWTPLFAIAGGIITQVGGILSHGAIVAREYGIPAVMAVQDATSVLKDGQRVTVDGSRGIVYLELA